MKLLLTNDDGIDAPGLAALAESLEGLGQVTVIAPDRHHSGCSHQTTVHDPLQLTERNAHRFALDGTPADCTRIGIHHVVPDADWVLAGINDGGNLGVDVFMSGTVAAAREAAIYNIPAIAISHYRERNREIDWRLASRLTRRVFEDLRGIELSPGSFWNVNLPHLSEGDTAQSSYCELDPNPLHVAFDAAGSSFQFRGVYQNRSRKTNSDVDHCFSGRIAITQIKLFAD